MRLDPDGSLDLTFEAPNIIYYNGNYPIINSIAAQSDGKILIAGGFIGYGTVTRPGLMRLNPDGTPDDSFAPAATVGGVNGLDVQPDGKILIGSNGNGRVVRLNADGTTDQSFFVDVFGGSPKVLPSGKILMIDTTSANRIRRLNSDGSTG